MGRLGANMNGGLPKDGRDPHDYQPTPGGTTRALLPALNSLHWPRHVWECAAGKLHMTRVLKNHGFDVVSTDLISRVPGVQALDFLKTRRALAPSIITNPPFKLAEDFIVHALAVLGVEYMALILPSGFWHADGRIDLFNTYTPALVLPHTWRIDNTGQGSPTLNCIWCVWHPGLLAENAGGCLFQPLRGEKGAGKFL